MPTRATSLEKYIKEDKHCPECKERLSYEKRMNIFCSYNCSASFYNRKNYPLDGRPKCKNCSNPLTSASCRTYCSDACKAHHKRGVLAAGDTSDVLSSVTRKMILVSKRGYICEMCGISEWNGKPAPLEVDHINGMSDDNRECNLRILCCNCHAQTPTYKSKNRGNGRLSLQKKKRLLAISADSSSDKETSFSG